VFWIVYNLHLLIKVNIQELYPSYFICYYDLLKSYLNFVIYSSSVKINVAFCLLMIILCIFAFKHVHRIRGIPREKRNQIRSMPKKDIQLLRVVYLFKVLFISARVHK
jgi:hypothetical protein